MAVGVALVVLGAAAASTIARSLSDRLRGPALAAAVAPTGILIGAGAALARDWDLVPSAVVGAVLVALLALTSGLRLQPRRRGPRT